MRKTLTIVLTVLALAIPPSTSGPPRRTPKAALKKIVVAKKTFTGSTAQADHWGDVAGHDRRQEDDHDQRDEEDRQATHRLDQGPGLPRSHGPLAVHQRARAPLLVQEALKAQSTHIYIISGATYTSDAFAQSLQAAITKEKAW